MVPPGVLARFGALPDRESAELLTALVYLENARGSAIIQHNWGNISCFASASVDFWRPPWFDLAAVQALPDTDKNKARYIAQNASMKANKLPSAFRAFDTHAQGINVWLATVKPSMYAAAASGDPEAFAHADWSSGYCPDLACKNSGPTFAKLQAEIRAKGYFAGLASSKKNSPPPLPAVPASPSPSAPSHLPPGSSAPPSVSVAVSSCDVLFKRYETESRPNAPHVVDWVVASLVKPPGGLVGLAAWYAERHRAIENELLFTEQGGKS